MNDGTNASPLEDFELFDNSTMSRVVNKITITKSNQLNFPAAFYSINNLDGKKGAMLYFNKVAQKIAVQFIDEVNDKGFKLALSNNGKYGAYVSVRSFLTLNNIEMPRYAGRYDYEKIDGPGGTPLFVIDLTKRQEGGDVQN
jgi:hypothetical protein